MKKHHEVLVRHPAVTADGKDCEILERITYERQVLADGSLSEAVECNRRFDLRTGEPLVHLGGDDYELRDEAGYRFHTVRVTS